MRRFVASCSIVLVAIALLGACGSSSKGAASPGTNANTSSTAGNGAAESDISKLYGDALKQKFKITFVDESGDETTYAQDGNGKSVYSNGDTQYFTTSDETVQCRKDSSGTAQCSSYPGSVGALGFLGIYNTGKTFVSALSKYGDSSSKTIADRDAACVTFSAKSIAEKAPVAIGAIASAIKGSQTYCVDKDTGVLLQLETKDADGKTTSSFTVTKYGEPSDSDFTLPATPSSVSIPSYSIPTITYPPGYTGPTIPGNG